MNCHKRIFFFFFLGVGGMPTSAPVFAAVSTTSMSWDGGIGPVDLAPTVGYCLWLETSDIKALVHNFLLEFVLMIPTFRYLVEDFALNLWVWYSFRWNRGEIDLGDCENLRGMLVEKTKDLSISFFLMNPEPFAVPIYERFLRSSLWVVCSYRLCATDVRWHLVVFNRDNSIFGPVFYQTFQSSISTFKSSVLVLEL